MLQHQLRGLQSIISSRQREEGQEGGITKVMRKLLGVMDMVIISIMVMVSRVFTCVKAH